MTFKICPSCGHQHDSADIICPYCKHSYSEKKVVCSNCGAYLRPADKYCYVCDSLVEGDVVSETISDETPQTPEVSPPALKEDTYIDDDLGQDVVEKEKKPKKRKAGVFIAIILILALALVGVGICYYADIIGNRVPLDDNKVTVYFNKPLSNVNLLDNKGVVYNWSGDVEVNYTLDESNYTEACKLTLEYDSMWYCKIPSDAKDVYFAQVNSEEIKTVKLSEVSKDTVYYISDILFTQSMELPLMSCPLSSFINQGVNYTQPQTTAPTTETASESDNTEETGESETETTPNTMKYTISIPDEWKDNIEIVSNENCVDYYEKYNYSNYECGKLFSVYICDENDNSYSDMNVKRIITRDDSNEKIVVVAPTDIQFNDSDDTAIEKYIQLSQYIQQVIDSIQ